MTNNEQPAIKNRESSIRWQGRTIEQFGYALNLILGLSVAVLGFESSLLLDETLNKWAGWQNCMLILSLLLMLLSVALGLACVINRLRDFRATTEIARNREDGASELELQPLRIFTRTLGERTWLLFRGQITTFSLGILLLVVAIGGTAIKLVAI